MGIRPGRLILTCGLPGSGKTTLARRLEAGGAVRLTVDDWMEALGFDAYDTGARQRVEALQRTLAHRLVDAGATVVLDHGVWTRSERDEARAWARSHGHAVELRFLDAPISELRDRIMRRNDALATGDDEGFRVDPADLEEWSGWLERPDDEELASFDEPTGS